MSNLEANREMPKIKIGFWTPKRIARIAILIALSGVGAFIKIPSPTGTVALDSAPGFFMAVAFGPVEGGLVAGIGHIFSAATTGFPLGLPIHLWVAVTQVIWAVLFWFLVKKVNIWIGIVVTVVCNGILSAASLIPFLGYGLFAAVVPMLTVGAAINILIAVAAYKIVQKSNLI